MAETGQTTVWTVGRLLDWTTAHFQEKNVEGGRLAAELLLARAMDCKKIELYTRFDREPAETQRTQFRDLVKLAGQHVPIAYLLGKREFFSLEFTVSPAVLIPRPETEALVQRAIDLCRQKQEETQHVLDIGTGSGCIAIAIAHYAPNARVIASDISSEALVVAEANANRHNVQDRIQCVHADAAGILTDAIPAGGFNLIVSNPPYISEEEWPSLPPNVRDHEPRTALHGGQDGLDMYRRLAAELPDICAENATVLVEIGHQQQTAVREIFCNSPPLTKGAEGLPPLPRGGTGGSEVLKWSYVGSYRDRSDPHERVLEFKSPPLTKGG